MTPPIPRTIRRAAGGVAAAALIAGAAVGLAGNSPASATTATAACQAVKVPVQVAGVPADVTGDLCTPTDAYMRAAHTHIRGWQLLIPGLTYNGKYFESGYQPDRYNYAAKANAAGWVTLAVDRPGTQNNGPWPPAADLTAGSEAAALDTVIRHFASLGKPVVVSHSFGSGIATILAGTHPADVRALVLSGLLSAEWPPGVANVTATVVTPVPGRPAGYFTVSPRSGFYQPGQADPGMVAWDEAHMRTTGTTSELGSLAGAYAPATTLAIPASIPKFVSAGQYDQINCDPAASVNPAADPALSCASAAALAHREAGDFTGPVTYYVEPGAGHDTALAPSARQWDAAVLQFAGRS
jgi:pimeloyl-ACP methyl ester carboxylesterase